MRLLISFPLLLLLLLMLPLLSNVLCSNTYNSHQDWIAPKGPNAFLSAQVLHDMAAANAARARRVGGRKFRVHGSMMVEKKKRNGGDNYNGGSLTSSPSSLFVVGGSGLKEEEKGSKSKSGSSQEIEVHGFVAFNADYRGPRHHPPKNN